MRINNFLFKIIIFLFLGTSYLSAVHVHHEHDEHSNVCEVCIVVNNFQSADTPNNSVYITLFKQNYFYLKIAKISNISYINKGYYSTAPPSC